MGEARWVSGRLSSVSVLVEAISVIVKVSAINRSFHGGLSAYQQSIPNNTFCSDGALARVGFMDPRDVQVWLEQILASSRLGINPVTGESVTTVVVDQMTGPTAPCKWVSTAHHPDGYRYAWLTENEPGTFASPDDWFPAKSKSLHLNIVTPGGLVVIGDSSEPLATGPGFTVRVFGTNSTDSPTQPTSQ